MPAVAAGYRCGACLWKMSSVRTLVDSERLCALGLAAEFKNLDVRLDVDELVWRFRGWKLADILHVLQAENSVVIPDNFVLAYRETVSD